MTAGHSGLLATSMDIVGRVFPFEPVNVHNTKTSDIYCIKQILKLKQNDTGL